jgi:hypothetical protein
MTQLLSVQKFFDGIVHDIVGGHKGAASRFTAFRRSFKCGSVFNLDVQRLGCNRHTWSPWLV